MIIFVVPAYNEEKNISKLLQNTHEKMLNLGFEYKIVLVNDGSTDRTSDIVKQYQGSISVILEEHEVNKGVKQAFITGFKAALKIASEDDIIVTEEADNTSDLSILGEMLSLIKDGYDVVLASCYAKGGWIENTNIYRKILSYTANALLKISFHIKEVNTYSSFYRAFNAKFLKKAFRIYGDKLLEEDGFVCVIGMLIRLNWLGFRVVEVPMVLKGSERIGKSKMKILKTICGYFKLAIKLGILKKGKPDRAYVQKLSHSV